MKTIHLIRHGETKANADGLFRGRIDYGLNARGMEESIRLRGMMKNLNPDKAFTSPMKRSMQTAELALQDICELVTEKLIDNLDLGDWAGKLMEEIRGNYPNEWNIWHSEPGSMTFPNGESMKDLEKRASLFLDKIKGDPCGNIAVFSHRSVIKTILGTALGLTDYFWKFKIEHSAVTTIVFKEDAGFMLTGLNYIPVITEGR